MWTKANADVGTYLASLQTDEPMVATSLEEVLPVFQIIE